MRSTYRSSENPRSSRKTLKLAKSSGGLIYCVRPPDFHPRLSGRYHRWAPVFTCHQHSLTPTCISGRERRGRESQALIAGRYDVLRSRERSSQRDGNAAEHSSRVFPHTLAALWLNQLRLKRGSTSTSHSFSFPFPASFDCTHLAMAPLFRGPGQSVWQFKSLRKDRNRFLCLPGYVKVTRRRSKERTLLVLTSAVGAVATLVRRGPRAENPCEIQVRSAPDFTGAFSTLTLTVSQRHLDHYFLSELEPAVSRNKDCATGVLVFL